MRISDTARSRKRVGGGMRLLPIVMVAGVGLSMLKGAELFLSTDQVGGAISPAYGQGAKSSDPQAAGKKPAKNAAKADTKTGDKAKTEAKSKAKAKSKANTRPKDVSDDPRRFLSISERAVLESLAKRRKAIDKRERELKLQQNLLKAAEKKIESRIAELKKIEQRITEQFTKEEKRKADSLKDLVALYENMKPQDAARIFNRLEMDVLVGLAEQIKPRKMASVLAKMTAENAERLTLELAARASGRKSAKSAKAGELPRIKDLNPG